MHRTNSVSAAATHDMYENPYQSPVSDDDTVQPETKERHLQQAKQLRRWLPVAYAWHVALPLGGALLSPVLRGTAGEPIQVGFGLLGTAVLFGYMLRFTTRLWPWVFSAIVSLLGVFPIVGIFAIALADYRSRQVIAGTAKTLL